MSYLQDLSALPDPFECRNFKILSFHVFKLMIFIFKKKKSCTCQLPGYHILTTACSMRSGTQLLLDVEEDKDPKNKVCSVVKDSRRAFFAQGNNTITPSTGTYLRYFKVFL